MFFTDREAAPPPCPPPTEGDDRSKGKMFPSAIASMMCAGLKDKSFDIQIALARIVGGSLLDIQ